MNWAQIIQGKRGNLDASKAQIIRQFPSTYINLPDRDRGPKPASFPHLLAKKRCIDCTLHLAEELHHLHQASPNPPKFVVFTCFLFEASQCIACLFPQNWFHICGKP